MKKYYVERNGLLTQKLSLSLYDVLEYFRQIYTYFYKKEYFEVAFYGIYEENGWTHERVQISSPTMLHRLKYFLVYIPKVIRYGQLLKI